MKVRDILESYQLGLRGQRFSQDELETLYSVIEKEGKELDMHDIKGLAQRLEDEGKWARGAFSAVLGLSRMHVLVHAVAPHGATQKQAGEWMQPSGPMDKFARGKGIDVPAHVARAERELRGRKKQAKIPLDDARKMMADHYKANRRIYPSADHFDRAAIIADIQIGLSPEEAFNRQLSGAPA